MALTEERLEEIRLRIVSALGDDHFTGNDREGQDIRMMTDMLAYIKMLNISSDVYEQYLEDIERHTTLNFADWAYENGFGNGVY